MELILSLSLFSSSVLHPLSLSPSSCSSLCFLFPYISILIDRSLVLIGRTCSFRVLDSFTIFHETIVLPLVVTWTYRNAATPIVIITFNTWLLTRHGSGSPPLPSRRDAHDWRPNAIPGSRYTYQRDSKVSTHLRGICGEPASNLSFKVFVEWSVRVLVSLLSTTRLLQGVNC